MKSCASVISTLPLPEIGKLPQKCCVELKVTRPPGIGGESQRGEDVKRFLPTSVLNVADPAVFVKVFPLDQVCVAPSVKVPLFTAEPVTERDELLSEMVPALLMEPKVSVPPP